MNNIKIYENIEFGKIRVEEIDNEPWFVGKDIAEILGYSDTNQAIRNHVDEEDKLIRNFNGSGQNRNMIIINESGLYSLILSSKLPTAKKFKKWITSEVIPSIRKNGGYIANQENLSDDELMAKALIVAQNKINEREKTIEQMKPNYLLGKAIKGSDKSIEVGYLANILIQNGRKDLGRNNLFEWFRNNGYLSSKKGMDWNRPTNKSTSQNLFEVKETYIEHNNGFRTISFTPLVTPKGQEKFINLFIYGGVKNETDR